MDGRRSAAPLGFGIANIVVGGLGLIRDLVSFVFIITAGATLASVLWGQGAVLTTGLMVVALLALVFYLAKDSLLLAGGIGLVRYRSWGRTVSLVAAGLWIALCLLELVGVIFLFVAGNILPAIIDTLLTLVVLGYCIALIVVLTRPAIADQLQRAAPRPAYAAAETTRHIPTQPVSALEPSTPRAPTPVSLPQPAPQPAPATDPNATQVFRAPAPRLSLQQIGGREDGNIKQLEFRDPFGNRITHVIGRDPECQIVVTGDPTISRRHCQLAQDNLGNVYVTDLDSATGTYVIFGNHRPPKRVVGKEYIQEGDQIAVGSVMFQVHETRAQAPGRR